MRLNKHPQNIAIVILHFILIASFSVQTATASSFIKGNVLPVHASVLHSPVTDMTQVLGLANLDNVPGHGIKIQPQEVHDYSATDTISFIITNPTRETLDATVLDAQRHELLLPMTQVDDTHETTFSIVPTQQFQPGKYTFVVKDPDGATHEQEFTRGLIALDTDQSVYQPDTKATISMVALSANGQKNCAADFTLSIQKPDGKVDELSTIDKSISTNDDCELNDGSTTPDYQARYSVDAPGTYTMLLRTGTGDNQITAKGSFRVENKLVFEIKRNSLIHIVPGVFYPMNITVTSQQDFDGDIRETVPESFAILPNTAFQKYDAIKTYLSVASDAAELEEKVMSAGDSSLEMPFNGRYTISQGFGSDVTELPLKEFYAHQGLAGHDGIDFALPLGTPLFAVDDGVVLAAGQNDYGMTVVIQHSWGRSYYGHLSKITVQKGYPVVRGSHIGYSGNTGESTGPHLHFAIRPNAFDIHNGYAGKVDPLPYLPGYAQVKKQIVAISEERKVLSASDAANAIPTVTEDTLESHQMSLDGDASGSAGHNATQSAEELSALSGGENNGSQRDNAALPFEHKKVITWHVSLKAGQAQELSYMLKAASFDPQYYLLGPLGFYADNSEDMYFTEDKLEPIIAGVDTLEAAPAILTTQKKSTTKRPKKGES